MSVYNGSGYLREAVDSILNQTFTNFEFIIINDCSTELQVGEILRQYEQQDQRIKLLQNETNLGLTKSLNKGLAKAKGEYIARMDADDISLPNRLKIQLEYIESNPQIAMVVSGINTIDETGRHRGTWLPHSNSLILKWHLTFRNVIRHSTVLWKRKLIEEKVGKYDPAFISSQDYDLWTRMLNNYLKIGVINQNLVCMRSHRQSISQDKKGEQDESTLKVVTRQMHLYINNVILSKEEIICISGIPTMARFKKVGIENLKKIDYKEAKKIYSLYFKILFSFYEQNQNNEDLNKENKEFLKAVENELESQVNFHLSKKQILLIFFFLRKYVSYFPERSIKLITDLSKNLSLNQSKKLLQKFKKKLMLKA
jgi:glycosyltransferase involved in cell wall biosynthesis